MRPKRKWEVDWNNPQNTGTYVWARSPNSHLPSARDWHLTSTGYLRTHGNIKTPIYRRDSWEVDWSKRNHKMVWARNPSSKMPSAKEWHWIDHTTLDRAEMKWKPKDASRGRHRNSNGYVYLTRVGMTEEEIAVAEKNNLFLGKRNARVLEHRLVAAIKYGRLDSQDIVRHLNGIKDDNRPENLVIGTTQQNTADHNSARLLSIYWKERCLLAEKELVRLNKQISSGHRCTISGVETNDS